jgi:hypothetical protein
MNRVALSTRTPTRREQLKSATARPVPEITDWDGLRSSLNARQFVGPATPISMRREFTPDAESARYWKFVDEIRRFGHVEQSFKGTPFLGDVFGY